MRKRHLWDLALMCLLVCLLFLTAPAVSADSEETAPEDAFEEEPQVKQGLIEADGKLYYYEETGNLFCDGYKEVEVDGKLFYYFFQEDGTAFTEGYKVLERGGKRAYYYFQEDGTAYTDGYLQFTVAEKDYYFFFQSDGTAFTGGYKEITLDGQLRYFYFLANGQGFNTGYKTATIDGKKCYFYFDSNGQAKTDHLQAIPLGDRTAYMLFQKNGRAFTGGYKAISNDQGSQDHYYFLGNGQAFTTGYKTVKEGNTTYYYFFQNNGKAYTKGLKEVLFGNTGFYYYFQENGRAKTSGWQKVNGKDYYLQANGRAVKSAFATVDKKLYYFDSSSVRYGSGWFCVGDGYYYAKPEGDLAVSTVVEGYSLNAAGKSATKYRIKQLVAEHTKSTMSEQEKIEALYNWLLKNKMTYIRTYEHTKKDWVWKTTWVDDMAMDLLNKNGGNCFRYAALLGLLVREATGLQVQVHHGMCVSTSGGESPHGWITVKQGEKWYIYDVELEKFSYAKHDKVYKVPVDETKLHKKSEGTNLYG